jgi:hypothetical protein
MPPGAAASSPPPRYVPLPAASAQPTSAAMTSMRTSVGTNAIANRGACVMKLRSKRAPSAQPISTCAALVSHEGIDENWKPDAVRSVLARSEPIMNPVGTLALLAAAPATAQIASSWARPIASNAVATGR